MSRRRYSAVAGKLYRPCILAVIAIVAVAGTPHLVMGCGLCATPGRLAISHPKSLDIAIATRREIDHGLLTGRMPVPANPADRHFRDLQLARVLVERLQLREGIELLLIEDASRYHVENAQELQRGQRAAVPSVRWVTARATLHAMLKGDLELHVAIQRGLLLVEQATVPRYAEEWMHAR